MNRDDIIRMAREANILEPIDFLEINQWLQDTIRELERFAALVAAAEREACAKQLAALGNDHCAAAIRARGKEAHPSAP